METTATVIDGQYAISYRLVDTVDNQGEPCERCQTENCVVEANVYGVVLYPAAALYECVECCDDCILGVVATMDPTSDVTVELLDPMGPDDRMSGPDDDRPHPDAL